MRGGHCLKAWSKTQALVAKSSGEAELYAVVRGAAEALGMATLARDLGFETKIQLHIDALAAKGMIERRGLSKVRHLDVNVLWLQEQCARKILPVTKVAGESNPADLMTKHLGGAAIQKNVLAMGMRFGEGRANKAAQLHQLATTTTTTTTTATFDVPTPGDGLRLWDAMGDRFTDGRGGDKWKCRGSSGVWQRVHVKPRRTLFTPFKVAKGPGPKANLSFMRFTKGVTQSGRQFEFHDKWNDPRNSHRMLDEPWVGCTVFTVEGEASLSDVQLKRSHDAEDLSKKRALPTAKPRWSDILD